MPAKDAGDLYIRYAKLEETHGLMRHAASVLDRACAAVEESERLDMFRLYVAKVPATKKFSRKLHFCVACVLSTRKPCFSAADAVTTCEHACVALRDAHRALPLHLASFVGPID